MWMKPLVPLAAAAALASALAGSAAAQTVPSGVGVYDARGQYFGNLIDQSKVWMRLPDGDAYVYIENRGRLHSSGDQDFEGVFLEGPRKFYTSRDCSGTPFLEVAELPPPGIFSDYDYSVGYPQRPYQRIVARSVYIPSRAPNAQPCAPLSNVPIHAGKLVTFRLPRAFLPLTVR